MTRTLTTAFLAALAAVALSLASAGCGGDDDEEAATTSEPLVTTVVGRVQGSDAFIAINSYRNGDLVAYVCDGKTLGETFNGRGRGSDGEIELTSEGGARITGTLTQEAADGTFTTAEDESFDFSARPPTGEGGVYRAVDRFEGQEVKAGWVVLSNGEQRGIVRVGGAPRPAPTLDPSRPTVRAGSVGTLQVQTTDPSTNDSPGTW